MQNKLEKRSLTAELRAQAESRTIFGYAAKFETWSEPIWGMFREKIARGAFEGADLSEVIMCFNHNRDDIMARTESGTLKLTVDETGLAFEFEVPNTSRGNDCLELVCRGDISKCSFAFTVEESSTVYANDTNAMKYDERTIEKFDKIYDVSLVVYPAYKDTEASARYAEDRALALAPPKIDTSNRDRFCQTLRMKINQ